MKIVNGRARQFLARRDLRWRKNENRTHHQIGRLQCCRRSIDASFRQACFVVQNRPMCQPSNAAEFFWGQHANRRCTYPLTQVDHDENNFAWRMVLTDDSHSCLRFPGSSFGRKSLLILVLPRCQARSANRLKSANLDRPCQDPI